MTGSIQEKKGKYYVVLNITNKDGSRTNKWISTGLDVRGNKKKAEIILRNTLDEWKDKNIESADVFLSDYFEKWLDNIKLEVSPNTFRSYDANMRNHIIPYFKEKKIKLQNLKPYELEDYYRNKLNVDGRKDSKGALSTTTIKHHHQNISKALSDAVRREFIPFNPAINAKTPKMKKFIGSFLNPDQLNNLITLYKGSIIEIPVQLIALYGLRRSEVIGLKWGCVDFDNRTITIACTILQNTGGDYEKSSTKNDSSYRSLPLSNQMYKVLSEHKKVQEERKKLMGNYYVNSDFVCTWQDGRMITPNYLSSEFHSILIKSTLPIIRLHDLRHSAASNLLANNFSVVEVQQWLGHSAASTTLNTYAHVDASSKKNMSDALDKLLIL